MTGYVIEIKIKEESLRIWTEYRDNALDLVSQIFRGAEECDNPLYSVSIVSNEE